MTAPPRIGLNEVGQQPAGSGNTTIDAREARLAALLGEITDDLQQGAQPDLQALMKANPDLADDLRSLWSAVLVAERIAERPAEIPHTQVEPESLWERMSDPLGPATTSIAPPSHDIDAMTVAAVDGNSAQPDLSDPAADLPTPDSDGTPTEHSTSGRRHKLPRRFGDYELLSELGRGGMGVVYKARQLSLGRIVALKMILRGELASNDDVTRFRNEAQAVAQLDHPLIVPVYEVGEIDSQHYFTMKYVSGMTLARRLSEGPMPSRESAALMVSVCDAIHYAHQRGLLHRDLKPSNILLDRQGRPHVTDFGLAKRVAGSQQLTVSGAILGTPSHMAPEQAVGARGSLSPASDVFSLGTILYMMLTGRPPFQAGTPVDTVLLLLEQEPLPVRLLNPRAAADLEMIALKSLQKPVDLRYATALAMGDDLRAYLSDEPIRARTGLLSQIAARLFRETHHAAILENWGLLWMWHSLALLIICLATNWLQLAGAKSPLPYLGLWVAGLGTWAAIFWALRRRSGPVTFVERQIAHVWAGSVLCIALLFMVEWVTGMPVLSLSPVIALTSGMVFLSKAGILTGTFYVQAAALFATALAMAVLQRLDIPLGITLFGVVSGLCFFVPGLKYYRQALRGR